MNLRTTFRGQPDLRQKPLCPGPDLLFGGTRNLQGESDVLQGIPPGEKTEILKNETYPSSNLPDFSSGSPEAGKAAHPDLPVGGLFRHVNQPETGGLS